MLHILALRHGSACIQSVNNEMTRVNGGYESPCGLHGVYVCALEFMLHTIWYTSRVKTEIVVSNDYGCGRYAPQNERTE